MRILLDMNLSPEWIGTLERYDIEAVHWSAIGDIRASDTEIMAWAAEHGYIVFTHDLDFGAMLVATGASAPSVIQVRTQDPFPDRVGRLVASMLHEYADVLDRGALVVLNERTTRVRILPLRRQE